MADSKITALTSISTSSDPANDPLVIVDVSDTSMAATGTTKKVTLNQLLATSPTATLASATITGDLTVDTSTLKVDSANNRVIVGHTSGSSAFQVTNAGAAGLEIQPTGFSSAPLILSYNRSGSAYTQLTLDGSTIVHALSGSTAMTLNANGLGVGGSPNISASGKAVTISGAFTRSRLELQNTDGGSGGVTCGSISWHNGSNLIADITGAANSGSATLGSLAFSTGGSTRLTIDSSGNVGIGVTPAGTGGCLQLKSGVTFPATQVASSDANTLDDYEEGTFTPTVTSVGGTGIVYTPVGDTGTYTKIGRLVTFTVNLYGTYTGTFTYVRIALPFTVGAVNDSVNGFNGSTGAILGGRTDSTAARFLVFSFQASGETGIYTGSYNV